MLKLNVYLLQLQFSYSYREGNYQGLINSSLVKSLRRVTKHKQVPQYGGLFQGGSQ